MTARSLEDQPLRRAPVAWAPQCEAGVPPFDARRAAQLMQDRRIDLLLATSRHNVQYMTGGHRPFFFAAMDAIGLSRNLSALGYSLNAADSFFVGGPNERWELEAHPLWVPSATLTSRTSIETAELVAQAIVARGLKRATIGVELPFIPADAYLYLRNELPHCKFVDAVRAFELLREVKQPHELELMAVATANVLAAMHACLGRAHDGMTTAELARLLAQEETRRGLVFDYCLISTGKSSARAPSLRPWRAGAALSIDSGGNKAGYLGDVSRMAVLGKPTTEMCDALAEVATVQEAAVEAISPGRPGSEVCEAASGAMLALSRHGSTEFLAHGIGLVSHEAPHLMHCDEWSYEGTDADRPLLPGMTISVETTMQDDELGIVKLEDTLAVTDTGSRAFCGLGRDWIAVDV